MHRLEDRYFEGSNGVVGRSFGGRVKKGSQCCVIVFRLVGSWESFKYF